VMALGFILQMTCLVPSSVSAPARHSMMALLPPPLGPTWGRGLHVDDTPSNAASRSTFTLHECLLGF
jgi:hypothetical protein